jgi:outer membrane receptor protein involved in Fe transport
MTLQIRKSQNRMPTNHRKMAFAIAFALGMGCGGVAMAQSTVGTVYGTADAGAQVEVLNLGSGQTRTIPVGSDGKFNVNALQPGNYRINVTSKGQTTSRDIRVVAGQGFNLDLATTTAASVAAAKELGTISVAANALPAIDISSVQSTTVLTSEQMKSLPIARNQTSVALLAPGASRGDSAFGNLVSIGGASVAENSYYVNGFNVTNLYQSLTFAQVPFEAIDQQEVQSGGYGAEYGNSTGGVISVLTKRGTNEWKGGVDYTWNPASLQASQPNIYLKNGTIYQNNTGNRNWSVGNVANAGPGGGGGGSATDFGTRWNAWLGGPLIKDKLFIFMLAGGTRTTDQNYGLNQNAGTGGYGHDKITQPNYMIKLDWNINDSNILEFTGFNDSRKTTTAVSDYNYDANGNPYHYNYLGQVYQKTGGNTDILKYTSYVTDEFTITAQYGRSVNNRNFVATAANGMVETYDGNIHNAANNPGCPGITDNRTVVTSGQVVAYPSCSFAGSLGLSNAQDTNKSGRIDFEYKLGDHDLTAGWSHTKFTAINGSAYEGGALYTYSSLPASILGYAPTAAPSDNIVQQTVFATGGQLGVTQKSYYVQDRWQVTHDLMVRIGVRNDGFNNTNASGQTYVNQVHSWQPRLGFSWDVHGDSSLKIYGSAGDYSLPLNAEVALRGASSSIYSTQNFSYTGVNPVTGAPIGLGPLPPAYAAAYPSQVGLNYFNGETGSTPNPSASAATNLRPFKQREFILGAQQQVADWTFGVKGTYRKVINGTDDSCDVRPIYAYANAHYGTNLPTDQLGPVSSQIPGGCFIFNPGSGVTLNFPLDASGKTYPIKLTAAQIGEPAYKRDYEALELTAERAFDNRFYVKASYVWSKEWGNTEGLVNSNNKQTDTGTSFLFDYPELMQGTNGYLPNDHRNTFKLYGAWQISPEWLVGANGIFQTGGPINCYGLNPVNNNIVGGYGNTYLYCNGQVVTQGSAGRTPNYWSLDLNAAYKPSWAKGVTLQANIFNVFNRHSVTSVNQQGQDSQGSSLAGTSYMIPTSFQTPRYVQLSAEYDFSL